jgi:hypothetical protein
MAGELHCMSLPAAILQQGFWLYVWKVGLPNGAEVHYVGMTGDTGSTVAQSAMNRVAAHLGRNVHSNALQRYLKEKLDVELVACSSLEFFAFGPVYPAPAKAEYAYHRGRVAALEKHLWGRLRDAGYEMLNKQPGARAELDEDRWRDVCAAFQRPFPKLKAG